MELHETAWNRMKKACSMKKGISMTTTTTTTTQQWRCTAHVTESQFDDGAAW
jgi:hypothetical protein